MLQNADVNLYTFQRLTAEFGPFLDASRLPGRVEHELVGARYHQVLTEIAKIVRYQWRQNVSQSALKGFLFFGGVGVGKTTMAKRLAYELCRVFDDEGPDKPRQAEIALVLIDGSDIARGRYGDSEAQLRNLFDYARLGPAVDHGRHEHDHHRQDHEPTAVRRTVLLFDDVESLLMSRSSANAKEWHFSQNSVFFHNVDELDTSRTVLVLTTNRKDLVDDAIVDRFLPYEFGTPPTDVLVEVAQEKARQQHLSDSDLQSVLQDIRAGGVTSMREVERLVTRAFVQKVLTED